MAGAMAQRATRTATCLFWKVANGPSIRGVHTAQEGLCGCWRNPSTFGESTGEASLLRWVAASGVMGFAAAVLLPCSEADADKDKKLLVSSGLQGPRPMIAARAEEPQGLWGKFMSMFAKPEVDVPLPTEKLTCRRIPGTTEHKPVVLVACGSFNPPTIAHLRMFDLATQALMERGYDVLGGYLSPVNDEYGKDTLAPAKHRIAMCKLAVADSPIIMVDEWEASQPHYQRTLWVLQRVQEGLADAFGNGEEVPCKIPGAPEEMPDAPTRSILLCGADMLESFTRPGVWKEDHVKTILGKHGILCIARNDTDVRRLLDEPNTVLHHYRDNIMVVEDPITNSLSSTKLREQIAKGQPIHYLTPNAVIHYIYKNGLYGASKLGSTGPDGEYGTPHQRAHLSRSSQT